MEFATPKITDAQNKLQKSVITSWLINLSAIKRRIMLIIMLNRPKVRIRNGKLITRRIGRTIVKITARTTPAEKSRGIFAGNWKPGSSCVAIHTAPAFSAIRIKNLARKPISE